MIFTQRLQRLLYLNSCYDAALTRSCVSKSGVDGNRTTKDCYDSTEQGRSVSQIRGPPELNTGNSGRQRDLTRWLMSNKQRLREDVKGGRLKERGPTPGVRCERSRESWLQRAGNRSPIRFIF